VLGNSLERCRGSSLVLQPRTCNAGRLTHARFGLFRVRSPLLAEYLLISFPEGTEMFHFPSFAAQSLFVFSPGLCRLHRQGFPHSEIHGSTLVCSSPWLIAAYHVLHRLLAPRHPPNALSSLTTKTFVSRAPGWGTRVTIAFALVRRRLMIRSPLRFMSTYPRLQCLARTSRSTLTMQGRNEVTRKKIVSSRFFQTIHLSNSRGGG
jgi:hypothetical protein